MMVQILRYRKKDDKDICEIGRLTDNSMLSRIEFNETINNYKKFRNTLDYLINTELDSFRIDGDDVDIIDFLTNISEYPLKTILDVIDSKVLHYIETIFNSLVYVGTNDFRTVSYFSDTNEDDEIYILNKFDEYDIQKDNDGYLITMDINDEKIGKRVDCVVEL